MAKRQSDPARVNVGGRVVSSSSNPSPGLLETVVDSSSDTPHRPVAGAGERWSDVPVDNVRDQLEMSLAAEIKKGPDANPVRLAELAAITDIDDHLVSEPARWFELPAERDERRERWAKAERRERWLRRFKLVTGSLGLVAYCAGIAVAGILLPIPEELVFIGLAAPVVIAILVVARRLLPGPLPPRVELKALTPEALMMQRFLNVASGIAATEAWRSDSAGRLDLDVEQHDIGYQLGQMESLGASIAGLTGSDDEVLVHALTKERARLSSVRMSMVDRLAALDRYRVSLEQVDVDTERAAKFSRVDEISSAMDMLEVGRASSEFSIDHTTRASEQLDQSIRISRRMLAELRGQH